MSKAGVDLASLSLYPATSEQVAESRRRQFVQWGQHLTEDQFNGLSDIYDAREQATGGKWTPWVLAPRDDPKTLDFMCACETYRRVALVKRPNSTTLDQVPAFGLACVLTPKANRGKGYASHMVRLLHWVLAADTLDPALFPSAWGAPPPKPPGVNIGDAQFCVLYSDAGADFYRMSGPTQDKSGGWEVKGNVSTLWEVAAVNDNKSVEAADKLRWNDLREEAGLEALWARDAQYIQDLVAAASLPSPSTAVIVSFLPTQGIAMYQVPRSRWHTEHMHTLDVWGTELHDQPADEPTYATWAVDTAYNPPRLIVTRIRASSKTFPLLINKILRIAKEAGLQKAEIWNLSESLVEVAASLGGRTYERTEHLPALRWYGKEQTRDIHWVFNEK
ncbi:hypothetical protein CONPUDRAFT_58204 [Coniophora puteana RWD-64-598 SS2]|uniref:LYC1 C-terminal domain-containing protein n=1 Tax=Coniophora puteana (strain RWD-64-598) TaxID=741705 RepID=A0A5M3ML19_CONPW|nr:uncharacterized protein CONPUDRAFT_58204 [Coniophora puteana RWD-64-598 SS2]EIW79939.1 hypothetical protein CONPUDRAFT_58204 [Coniophora puteana RWD-64-598 SS2]